MTLPGMNPVPTMMESEAHTLKDQVKANVQLMCVSISYVLFVDCVVN